jgi:hypothetical protein
VEGGGGGLNVSGVSQNCGGFVKCVAIQKRLGIPALMYVIYIQENCVSHSNLKLMFESQEEQKFPTVCQPRNTVPDYMPL